VPGTPSNPRNTGCALLVITSARLPVVAGGHENALGVGVFAIELDIRSNAATSGSENLRLNRQSPNGANSQASGTQ
jgi:hypothetical protein